MAGSWHQDADWWREKIQLSGMKLNAERATVYSEQINQLMERAIARTNINQRYLDKEGNT